MMEEIKEIAYKIILELDKLTVDGIKDYWKEFEKELVLENCSQQGTNFCKQIVDYVIKKRKGLHDGKNQGIL